jgi:hypothetical protein
MAVPRHLKVVVRGQFDNTPEIWSYSMRFDRTLWGEGDAHAEDLQDGGMLTALTAFHSTSLFSPETRVTGWRAYDIGEDGRMEGNPKVVEIATASQPKGTASSRMPIQTSLVVTTEAENRGPARYGRFFLPGPAKNLGTDYRILASDALLYLNAAVTFYKAVSDRIDVDFSVTGVKAINVSNIGTGAQQTIRNLRVGRVYDTLRSRRGALLEEYQSSGTIDW